MKILVEFDLPWLDDVAPNGDLTATQAVGPLIGVAPRGFGENDPSWRVMRVFRNSARAAGSQGGILKHLPETGFLRLPQIIGQSPVTEEQAAQNRKSGRRPVKPRPGMPAIIPVSSVTWWRGIKEGRFPPGVKLSGGVTVWRAEDIRKYIDEAGGG